jgi:hypothetical protein
MSSQMQLQPALIYERQVALRTTKGLISGMDFQMISKTGRLKICFVTVDTAVRFHSSVNLLMRTQVFQLRVGLWTLRTSV